MLWTLMYHEWRSFFRNGASALGLFSFTLLLAVVSSFAFRYPGMSVQEIALAFSGSLWLIALFSGSLTLSQSWQREREDRAVWGIWLATGASTHLYFAKLLVGTVLFVLQGFVAAVALAVFFGLDIRAILPQLLLLLALCGGGVVALGTLLSSVAAGAREREVVFPLLFFPLLLLLLSHAVSLTSALMQGQPLELESLPIAFLVIFDIVTVALAYILFPSVVTE